jgi:predicted nucleic-acid-binding Zn-ribbon protein
MKCSRCNSPMQDDKHLQALGSELELVSYESFRGDRLKVFYCEKCGYVELYRVGDSYKST